MSVGLSREEFEELRPIDKPLISYARRNGHAGWYRETYPKGRSMAVQELRDRGYAATGNVITNLVRRGVCRPHEVSGNFVFGPAEIDAMAERMESDKAFNAEATLCLHWGARLADFLRSRHAAYVATAEEYGEDSFSAGYFEIVGAHPGLFSLTVIPKGFGREAVQFIWTLTPEARQQIERGPAQ